MFFLVLQDNPRRDFCCAQAHAHSKYFSRTPYLKYHVVILMSLLLSVWAVILLLIVIYCSFCKVPAMFTEVTEAIKKEASSLFTNKKSLYGSQMIYLAFLGKQNIFCKLLSFLHRLAVSCITVQK